MGNPIAVKYSMVYDISICYILAVHIAISTVKGFMQKETSVKKVVFTVFKDLDKEIYSRSLKLF